MSNDIYIKIDFGSGFNGVKFDKSISFTKKVSSIGLNTIYEFDDITFTSNFNEFTTAAETSRDLPVKIYRGTNNIYTGVVLLEGEFNIASKTCKLKIEESDDKAISLIQQNWENNFNIINENVIPRVDSSLSIQGNTFSVFQPSVETPSPPTAYGFIFNSEVLDYTDFREYSHVFLYNKMKVYDSYTDSITVCNGIGAYCSYDSKLWYANEDGRLGEPGVSSDWTEVPSPNTVNAYRMIFSEYKYEPLAPTLTVFPKVYYNEYFEVLYGVGNINTDIYYWKYTANFTDSKTFDKGSLIQDVIEAMLNEITGGLISIEKLNTSSDDYWFPDIVGSNYEEIHLHDKSNIKSPNGDGWSQNLTFKRLMEIYKYLFNVDWTIENNIFKLISPTNSDYYNTVGIDARSNSRGNLTYENLYSTIISEKWNTDTSGNVDFDEMTITYSSTGRTINYSMSDVANNILDMINENTKIDNDGICFVCVSKLNGVIIIVNDAGTPDDMNFPNLFDNFINKNRERKFGKYKDVEYTFTTNGNNAGGSILYNINIEDVNIYQLVKTQLSEYLGITGMRIDSVKQAMDSSICEITLTY